MLNYPNLFVKKILLPKFLEQKNLSLAPLNEDNV
jgi:hypothetical protein